MATTQQETDRRIVNGLIEDLAQDIAALTLHAGENPIYPKDIVPPSELSERLGVLVWAFGLLRCKACGQLADQSGRICTHCASSR